MVIYSVCNVAGSHFCMPVSIVVDVVFVADELILFNVVDVFDVLDVVELLETACYYPA